MRFSLITAAALVATATASPIAEQPAIDPTKAVTETWEGPAKRQEAAAVQKRSVLVTLLTAAGTAAASQAATLAVNAAKEFIADLAGWEDAREAFTQQTTQTMWANNPDYGKYAAAICYNKGYHVEDPSKISEVVSAELKSGVLKTDYDCMYMERGNAFYTWEEGGFINLSYTYNEFCSHDRETGDLRCN